MKNLSRVGLSIFLIFFPSFILAANPLDVVINEIAWMGTKVEEVEEKNWWRYEWLELYNNTDQPISLEGWKIELYRTDLDWSLQLKGIIQPRDYFLIVSSDKIFKNYDFNYSNLGGKFINSGQKVILKDNSGNVVDNLDCFSFGKWFAGDNLTKQTMERKDSHLIGDDPNNWVTSQNPGGTPRSKNSLFSEESKLPNYPSGIIINEILPSPQGPDEKGEYIEIFNQNDFEVDLSGWKIADVEGITTTYNFQNGKKISAKGFLVLYRTETKITLNNNGDGLNLIQPDGKIVDSVSYQNAPKGKSFNRKDSEWLWSQNLTPGKENIFLSNEVKPEKKEEKSPPEIKEIEKKEMAAIGKGIEEKNFSPLFLIALFISFFFSLLILFLKKRLEKFDFRKGKE